MKKILVSLAGFAAIAALAFGQSVNAEGSHGQKFIASESQALDKAGDNNGVRAWTRFAQDNAFAFVHGRVSAVSDSSISVLVKHHDEDGTTVLTDTYTFSVDTHTKVVRKYKGSAAINQVSVGDVVSVWASNLTGGHARLIWDTSIWWVGLKGTISNLDSVAGTFTLSFSFKGVTVSTTVKTDSATTYSMDGTAKTFSDLANGQKVEVRGSWDSANSWLLAKKITIKS